MSFRNYLTGTIFVILLLWGPIDDSWSGSLMIRISYLILIPLIVWVLFGWIWSRLQPADKFEVSLNRILSAIISVGLFILAVIEATSATHLANTRTIRTRDGYEDVGDYIRVTRS